MAAQDLIISRRNNRGPTGYMESDPAGAENFGPDGAAVLFTVLRSRWLLLVVIGVVSGGLAALAAWQFNHKSAVIKAAIIYTGPPNSVASNVFDPLGAATGAEMITSVKVVGKLCEKRGLDISPTRMADAISPTVGRSSSLVNLSLTWSDPDEGIEILNELMNIFIDEMASQRKEILKQNLQHLEMTLLQARSRVDEARRERDALQGKQEQELAKGGLAGDQYRSTLSNIDSTKQKIIDKQTEQLTIGQQIAQVASKIENCSKKQLDLQDSVKKELLRETQNVLLKARDGFAANSPGAEQINQTIASITKFVKSSKPPKDFDQWQKSLSDILNGNSTGLSDSNRKKLDDAFANIGKQHEQVFRELNDEQHRLEESRDQLELNLIPIKNAIAMLQQQQATYEKDAAALGEKITGVSATQLDEAKHILDEAEKQQDSLMVQRDALRQLAEGRTREWTVTVPASTATTQIESNSRKVFILVFGVCCFALSAPLFVSEWHAQSGTPQMQMAQSLRVPVLAERILEHFSPHERNKSVAALPEDKSEMLRMLTLRIQQSCHRPGSVVLFSSLDPNYSAAPLMATVAECLAEREERVLLIDAVCPHRSLIPVLNVSASGPALPAPTTNGKKQKKAAPLPLPVPDTAADTSFGLSEYLSAECEEVRELIRPTGCPGVDLITSGRGRFSREAMASSCLTELFNTCRKNYTMVLVHGPSIACAADLQMLTARADGIVLTATKQSGKNPLARDFVQDLLDLGAPLIGLVA